MGNTAAWEEEEEEEKAAVERAICGVGYSLFHGLVLRQVKALRDDGVCTPVRTPILQQDANVVRPQHRLFDRHFEAGQCGLSMSTILVDLLSYFADPETRVERGQRQTLIRRRTVLRPDICRIFSSDDDGELQNGCEQVHHVAFD